VTPDRLDELLREITAPQATEARERTVAEARAAVEARTPVPGAARTPARRLARIATRRPARSAPRLLAGLAAAALVVAVVLLTPPGRAASAWVGELVGIGDVGGPPTQDGRGPETSEEVVIDNGRAPDGTRYEWVAYRCEVDLRDEGLQTRFQGIGVSLDWPGARGPGGGGGCEEATGSRESHHFTSHGVHILPSQFKGVERPDLVVAGSTGPRVHRVRIIYTDRFGEEHELPVDFARVEGKLRELAHRSEPLGTFTAFIPGDWAARDELESRLDLRALYGTGELELGSLGRRERAQARQAFEICEPLEPDPDALPESPDQETLERAFAPYNRCMKEHLPPSPIEYVTYDAEGRELERLSEPLIAYTRSPLLEEAEGREQPGDKRSRPPTSPGESDPVVLISGRAPDGALYEVYATHREEDAAPFGHCVTLWWPYVRDARVGGGCGPRLPPEGTFRGRGRQREVAAKADLLSALGAAATRYLVLDGYARPDVSRVQVRYRDRQGNWHEAPVDLKQIDGPTLERARADAPFGVFVAFVPRSVDRCQGGKAEDCMGLEVVAYGEDGRELSRLRGRSDLVDGA
jgi:hypothetical protein